MIRVSVGDAPDEIKAAVLAMKRADADTRKVISADMRSTMGPVWKQEVSSHLTGAKNEARMLNVGVRIAAGNPPSLVAANSRRKLGRELTPTSNFKAWEFGAAHQKLSEYKMRTRNGKSVNVKRHTRRGLPPFKKGGRVLYPTAGEVIPRIAAFWVQSIVRAFLDAAEGKK